MDDDAIDAAFRAAYDEWQKAGKHFVEAYKKFQKSNDGIYDYIEASKRLAIAYLAYEGLEPKHMRQIYAKIGYSEFDNPVRLPKPQLVSSVTIGAEDEGPAVS
jgi:hypothetical protein